MPHIDLNTGVNLYYEEAGEGPAVLLIPGSGFSLDVWNPHPVADLKTSFRVITFDPRGLGRSAAKDTFLTVEQMAADAAELLHQLEVEQVHVVGHSLGGRVALALSLTYPGLVRSLTMAASGSGAAIRAGETSLSLPQHRYLANFIERGFKEHIRYEIFETDSYFTSDFRKSSPEVVAEFYEKSQRNHATLPWYLRQLMARTIFEATHRLSFLQVPTMVLVGSSDLGGGSPHYSASLTLAERIPDAELRVIEGVSHGFFWQEPQLVADILSEWFNKH